MQRELTTKDSNIFMTGSSLRELKRAAEECFGYQEERFTSGKYNGQNYMEVYRLLKQEQPLHWKWWMFSSFN